VRSARLAAVTLAAVLAAGLGATVAGADGDPASDYLIVQKVFFPFDAKIPQASQQKLLAAVTSANTQGFKIRVALIWSDYDLGAVTALWKQPRRYARFLGVELGYYYHGRLLIVMPSGFGFNWPKHSSTAAYTTLSSVDIGATPAALADAATEAVRRLASADGVQVSTTGTVSASGRNVHDRVVIVAAVAAAMLLGAAARILIRRRASAGRSE
jgi:hypothetical protein